jgi:G6PDH family F420-dependent oxidoreductase
MAAFGFHASHEQIPPSKLLQAVAEAEAAGFSRAMCSDHFSPWSERQGESGFAWAWLGAALQATALPFGVVNSPGQRYHPAVVAQAVATLEVMFPGRFWIALGTGEFSNEHITGDPWPDKRIRTARLAECVAVIRALLAGEIVDHDGLVRVDRARLWTLPSGPPPLIGAAVSPETAAWVATWADGLITIWQGREQTRRVLEAFRNNGGPRLLPTGHASPVLRGGDRHGREPRRGGTNERAFPDAVVGRAASRVHYRGAGCSPRDGLRRLRP